MVLCEYSLYLQVIFFKFWLQFKHRLTAMNGKGESDAFLRHIITCGMPQFYCTNKINMHREDIINSIIIGPRSSQNPKDLENYCRHLGLHKLAQNIKVSDCPLR